MLVTQTVRDESVDERLLRAQRMAASARLLGPDTVSRHWS